jgi:hypothetical protein
MSIYIYIYISQFRTLFTTVKICLQPTVWDALFSTRVKRFKVLCLPQKGKVSIVTIIAIIERNLEARTRQSWRGHYIHSVASRFLVSSPAWWVFNLQNVYVFILTELCISIKVSNGSSTSRDPCSLQTLGSWQQGLIKPPWQACAEVIKSVTVGVRNSKNRYIRK